MKKILSLVLLTFAIAVLLVTPVLAYTYYADINLQETNGNAYTMFPARTPLNTTGLITGGYLSATGLDSRVSTGINNLPHMLADDKLLFASVLPALSAQPLFLYVGEAALPNYYIITGWGGYVTTADAVALEPGNNFEVIIDGYIDTSAGANKYLLNKDAALEIFISGAGDITAVMYGNVPGNTDYDPTADGTTNQNTIIGGQPTAWQTVMDNNDATYLENATGAWWTDLFVNPAIYTDRRAYDVINTVTVYMRQQEGANNCEGSESVRSNGTTYYAADHNYGLGWVWENNAWATDPDDAQPWTTADLQTLEFGFRQQEDTGADARVSESYVNVNYTPSIDVTATGVATGEHVVRVVADGVDLKIFIDGSEEDSRALGGQTAPNNANDFIWGQNNVCPYVDYIEYSVGGTLIVDYEPVTYIVGTALPDKEGAAQDGVITWGVNPAGVIVITGGLVAYDPGAAAAGVLEVPGAAGEINQPSDMFPSDAAMSGLGFFLEPPIAMIAGEINTPIQWIWWLMAAAVVVMAVIIVYRYIPNLLMAGFAGAGAMGACIGMAFLPFWFIFIAVAAVMVVITMERSPSV